ncbi:MAG: ATP cone domain-containing protein, partial [Deltaproteobacteria bacterium]
MSKDSLTVVRSNGDREPFLRGIMTRTLTEQGVSFEKAYLITKEVKKKLNRRRQITSTDLGLLLEKYLEQKHPRLQRNPIKSELPQLWVHRGESRYPFSKGMLSQSITSAGISPGKAYLISRQIEQDLILLGKIEIKSEELIQLVRQQLQAQFSPEIARTYEVASRINDLPHPVILYVAGAPGTGKSTLAQALASRLGILNVVGTDSIREVMRLSFSKEIVPTLHVSSFEAGSQLVFDEKKASQERMIAGFVLQSQQVCVGIRAMVRRAIAEGTNLLIEGVHLLPFLVRMP